MLYVDEVFEFGPYRLEPGLGLTRGGSYVALAPKELGVLEALARREGRVVSKEELATEVWRGQALSDDSLARTVYALRKILAGGCEAYIATAHRRGYRLAVPVRRVAKPTNKRSVVSKSIDTAPAAYAAFLEGRQYANRGSISDLERAIEYFERALAVDPDYAVALGAIAECRIYQAVRRHVPAALAEAAARSACDRALALDRELVSARAALGWIEGSIAWNNEAAIAALDEAIALDSTYARGYYYRGWVLRGLGRHDASLDDLRRACALDPYAVGHQRALAYSLFCARRFDEALESARRMVAATPDEASGYTHVATYASYVGDHDEAIAAGRKAARLSGRDGTLLVGLAYALARVGRRAYARKVTREIAEAIRPAAVRSLVAPVYLQLGDPAQAESWLRQAAAERCAWFTSVLEDPRMESLEELKQFKRLARGNSACRPRALRGAPGFS